MTVAELEARAATFEGLQRLTEAKEVYEAALRLDPGSQSLAEGRARVALGLMEAGALEHCQRALAFHDSNPDRQLLMITTAATELGCAAIALFEDFLRRNPLDVTAHELLAELRAECGAGDNFIESYTGSLSKHPANKALLMSYWNTLTRAGRMEAALDSMDSERSLFDGDRDFAVAEARIANHAGLTDRASRVLEGLDDLPDAVFARAQNRLQTGNLADATKLLELVIRAEPDNLSAWALVELAWRILGDARHAWLIGEPPLYSSRQLELGSRELEQIAVALRVLHRSRSQPMGQSVRGGTQTSGQLFIRAEPEVGLLADAIADGIRDFVGSLPPADPGHPLLKHRDMGMAFGPSWSVRLTDGGYHAAHFHPGGILSSACYIKLPPALADADAMPGWLELGRPPPELNLDVPPLATIEPREGQLVLFPSFLFHGTRLFHGGERLTVAFDLVPVPMDR